MQTVQTVALMGAGGKMGCRLTDNLKDHPEYRMRYVEVGESGIARLAERGLSPTPPSEALSAADIVILALPDRVLGEVAREIVPQVRPGTLILTLDPAAPHAGELPTRDDISYFVTHPCHPPVFNYDATPEERRDFFGGVKAPQAIVCALMQGPEADYARGEAVAVAMYAPVTRSHRVTVEQMAILEPAMAETVAACCITIIREAMDEAIARGVPPEAAKDFLLGHVNIPLAIVFGEISSPFSDGAKLIIEHGRHYLFKPDWRERIFAPESVLEQVRAIVNGTPPPNERRTE
ncbi:MAG: phosphogluconate dehydrogenase C-terminal domain-containing protein [Capsulimonadales bacterium]|nr:phosphogluconate dehydrogenase C-terminal domain-containing protein [Capsulimonadales bacterium]